MVQRADRIGYLMDRLAKALLSSTIREGKAGDIAVTGPTSD